jgi:hypothetical protein
MPRPEEVLKHVRAVFKRKSLMNLYRYLVLMTCKGDILALDREVKHIGAKKLSREVAAAVPGIDGLVDRLRVAPTLPMHDGTIRNPVRDVLLQEPAFVPFAPRKRDGERVESARPAAWHPQVSLKSPSTTRRSP